MRYAKVSEDAKTIQKGQTPNVNDETMQEGTPAKKTKS